MIIYDRSRYSDAAWENLWRYEPRRWELEHGHCARCGSWVEGREVRDDDSCPVCEGQEVQEVD